VNRHPNSRMIFVGGILNPDTFTHSLRLNSNRIEITLNVNHTVDAETPEEAQQRGNKQQDDAVTMKSRPSFSVDIIKGAQTLTFSCSYMRDVDPVDTQEEYSK